MTTTQDVDPEELYDKVEKIGKGSFGEVFKGIDKKSQKVVAIKIIDLESADDEIDEIEKEIKMLSGVDSDYCTRYYGSYLIDSKIWIIMEFCGGGSCLDLMKPRPFEELFIAIVLREVLKGLDYLHSNNKLHRDIKAANILLTTNGEVKLADFGVSGQISSSMSKKNTFVGTPFWMAPEVIEQSGYDYTADIWSLGVTIIELAKGQPPHADVHPMRVLFLIPKSEAPQLEGSFSKTLKELVSQCLQKDAKQRPSAKQLLNHKFVKNAKKTSYLMELLDRYETWHAEHGSDDESETVMSVDGKSTSGENWEFGTAKKAPPGSKASLNTPGSAAAPKQDTTKKSAGSIEKPPAPVIKDELKEVVEPVLNKLQSISLSPKAQQAYSTLKKAFDMAEKANPGTTQKFFKECLQKMGK